METSIGYMPVMEGKRIEGSEAGEMEESCPVGAHMQIKDFNARQV